MPLTLGSPALLPRPLADIFAGDADLGAEIRSFNGMRLGGAGAHRGAQAGEKRDDDGAVLALNATLFEHFYLSDHEAFLTEQP